MIAVAKRLINREEYYKMAEVGILKPTDHVELINGEIIEMSPIGSKHAASVHRLTRVLRNYLDDSLDIRNQSPIIVNDQTEPEPDIAIVRLREDDYAESHPNVSDIALIIEVSDSTIDYDRTTKAVLYAQAGISIYWVVDVERCEVAVYSDSMDRQYTKRKVLTTNDQIEFLGSSIKVSELMIA